MYIDHEYSRDMHPIKPHLLLKKNHVHRIDNNNINGKNKGVTRLD